MTPLTLDLETIIDYGALVSLVGKDQATGKPVAVHLDYRSHPCPPDDLRLALAVEPTRFAAAQGLAVAVEFALTAGPTEKAGSRPFINGGPAA